MNDTIVAPATPNLPAARAIIRVSGDSAFDFVAKTFKSKVEAFPRRGIYSVILNLKIGECPAEVWTFTAPNSATGENCVEIHFPGSPFLVDETLAELCQQGCRVAESGEFTRRAFLNARLDLSQAEAVMTLVSSAESGGARAAQSVYTGSFSRRGRKMIDQLEELCARFEVSFDFDEEAAELVDMQRFEELCEVALRDLQELVGSKQAPRSDLPRVVLVGAANAGKSTLFNALLGKERALISGKEGTTRDLVVEEAEFSDLQVELVDTAGEKIAESLIEHESQQLREEELTKADLILLVVSADSEKASYAQFVESLSEQSMNWRERTLIVRTKLDRQSAPLPLEESTKEIGTLHVCAPRDQGVVELGRAIASKLRRILTPEMPAVSARQAQLLFDARETLEEALSAMRSGTPIEVVSDLARAALSAMREAFGFEPSADVLDRIFSSFCIGK